MPRLDLSSNAPLPPNLDQWMPKLGARQIPAPDPSPTTGDSRWKAGHSIWLDGDVIMCPCPDCRAPMSIRLWLMIADCWQCGTSIALTEEQEREAQRLLQARDKAAANRPKTVAESSRVKYHPDQPPKPSPRSGDPRSSDPSPAKLNPTVSPRHVRKRAVAANKPNRTLKRIHRMAMVGTTRVLMQDVFSTLPAWVISGLLHLVLLMLLGLWMIEDNQDKPFIVLSAELNSDRRVGGVEDVLDTQDKVIFDLPIPPKETPKNPQEMEALIRADQIARQLRIDPETLDPQLPELYTVKVSIASSDRQRSMLAVRDPRVRVEMIKKEGGTTLTEAAVARGLRWMSLHQHSDGSWGLHDFHQAGECNGRCDNRGSAHSNAAGTSLVLLPFLGAGQTHLVGRYKSTVSQGLRWLVEHQKPDGDLRADSHGNSGMYAHGQAAIVLCEAFAMTGDEALKDPAQRAIDFIVQAQHPTDGGWRYEPRQPGDTSVLGWQLMALQSARAAQLEVPHHTLENASHFLDKVQNEVGSLYSYFPGHAATHPMTAEALLSRTYLGWKQAHPGLRMGARHLVDQHPPAKEDIQIYYWYYATQFLHHMGGPLWDQWNQQMRDILVHTQEKEGHQAGTWTQSGHHGPAGGRLYVTALATCTLEVYYRHAPIFRQIKLD